jgi:hypothetical membrane protein
MVLSSEHAMTEAREGLSRHRIDWKCNGLARIGAISGTFAPIVLLASLIVAGLFRPGYDHATQTVSELGAYGDASAIVMNIGGFFIFGVLVVLFGLGFSRGFSPNRDLNTLFSAAMIISGTSIALIAFFPVDTGQPVHPILGAITPTLYFAPWLAGFMLKGREELRIQYLASMIAPIAIAFFAVIWRLTMEDSIGIFQRVPIAISAIWIETLAVAMLQDSRRFSASQEIP